MKTVQVLGWSQVAEVTFRGDPRKICLELDPNASLRFASEVVAEVKPVSTDQSFILVNPEVARAKAEAFTFLHNKVAKFEEWRRDVEAQINVVHGLVDEMWNKIEETKKMKRLPDRVVENVKVLEPFPKEDTISYLQKPSGARRYRGVMERIDPLPSPPKKKAKTTGRGVTVDPSTTGSAVTEEVKDRDDVKEVRVQQEFYILNQRFLRAKLRLLEKFEQDIKEYEALSESLLGCNLLGSARTILDFIDVPTTNKPPHNFKNPQESSKRNKKAEHMIDTKETDEENKKGNIFDKAYRHKFLDKPRQTVSFKPQKKNADGPSTSRF